MLDGDAVAAVPASARDLTQVDAVAVPFVQGSAVPPALAGTDLLTHLAQRSGGARLVPVVDAGRVTGVLDLADVARAIRATVTSARSGPAAREVHGPAPRMVGRDHTHRYP